MDNHRLKDLVLDTLEADDRLWNEDKTEFNQTKLLDLVEQVDETVIDLLLQQEDLRERFFVQVRETYVFKTNDFRFFIQENTVNNSYTQYKNRIGLTDGERFLRDTNDVVLNFPYKDCILEGGQSSEEGTDVYFEYDEKVTKTHAEKFNHKPGQYNKKSGKREEIFFNSVLAQDEIDRLLDPKALVNWKRYTQNGTEDLSTIKRHTDGTPAENMILKGNNLLALHSLKEQFAGKVKLIYIDPPYNTGNDEFKYNDNFNHSTWLTFMKNRLEVAKELLRDDGVIFVNIDDDESHYLKVLMDEIFHKENFIANIVWQKKYTISNDARYFSDNHDHILVFCENKDKFKINGIERQKEQNDRYKNPDNDPNGPWMTQPLHAKSGNIENFSFTFKNGQKWSPPRGTFPRYSKEKLLKFDQEHKIWFGKNGNSTPRLKKYLKDMGNVTPATIWAHSEVGNNDQANRELKNLIQENIFDTPKPEKLLQRIIQIGSNENNIILDFFMGSGTTTAVAHKMGRQYIGIEQMDYIEDIAVERQKKVVAGEQGGISQSVEWQGGGDFIYCELAKWNERAKEQIQECESLEELIDFFDDMYDQYFLNYTLKVKEFKEKVIHEQTFRDLSLEEQKKMFMAMLDNNQMYVNKTEMADKRYGISEEDQRLSEEFYKE